jgi:hypothetical protein
MPLLFYITALFLLIVVAVVFFVTRQLYASLLKTYESKKKSSRKFFLLMLLLFAWFMFLYFITQRNILNNFSVMPPPLMLVILIPFISSVVFTFSKKNQQLISNIPFANLIYLQTFRVAVEVVLWLLFTINIIPVQMTFEGRNYDILAGLSALFTGYYYVKGVSFFKNKWVLIVWNIAGLILLFNIVIVAILSAPFPFRYFLNEPANTIVFYFPFVLLPGFLVPVAFLSHLIALKKLSANKF